MADENTAGGDAGPTGDTEAKPALQPDPASTDTPEADQPAGDTEATTGQDDPKTDDDGSEPEGEPDKPKRKGGFQRRIERMQAERDFLLEELLKRRQEGQPQRPAPTETAVGGEPDAGDAAKYPLGSFDPKYHADVARNEVRKELMQAEEGARRQHVADAVQAKAAAFRTKGAEAAKAYGPDFAESLADLLSDDPETPIKISPPMTAVLLEADRGPEVAVWLHKHPAEAARIAGMPDVLAARELGRIEAKLPDPPARRQTAAPNPPKEVQGGNSKVTTYDPHKDDSEGEESYERWKAWRRKQG